MREKRIWFKKHWTEKESKNLFFLSQARQQRMLICRSKIEVRWMLMYKDNWRWAFLLKHSFLAGQELRTYTQIHYDDICRHIQVTPDQMVHYRRQKIMKLSRKATEKLRWFFFKLQISIFKAKIYGLKALWNSRTN